MASNLKIIEQNTAYQGYIRIDQYRLQFLQFNGTWSGVQTREVCRRGEAVVVLPYDPVRDTVLLIEQFRLPAYCQGFDPWLLELPAGMLDHGDETPAQVATREMTEETGLAVEHLRLIHKFLPTPGVLAETIHLFVGRVDLTPLHHGHDFIHGHQHEGEDIKLRPTPFSDIAHLLSDNRIYNGTSMIGLYWLLQHRDQLRKEWISS